MCTLTPDEKTAEYCEIELNEFQKSLVGDEDAKYLKTVTYRAEDPCSGHGMPVSGRQDP